ncbi:TadE/TadG family type IV pilus assembly protein [Streptomyces europaeiscabiei]|uniref:TadE/TadG family type IV pilus assembly protein n=1 Tax=Streptomyces europaeiscabiei TaxID=146819 RepID=UPI0029A916AD|nr:TadE/TadG family type IV pilus assembly protein [Streptomyces europaeiscabiei]MDX2765244.1 TadE/TadG family type IV pilus assembly protein [Streptomyces europaeiscabiei]
MNRLRALARHLRTGGDRGSAALEVAVIAPAIIAMLGLMIAFGRVIDADGAVDAAAHAAARAASLERDATTAQSQARTAAEDSLSGDGIACQSTDVTVDTSDFALDVGQAATVTATISCTARLSDIGLPGLPGAKTLTATFTSPIDTYRGRQ